MINKRRKQQLIMEGIDPEKIEENVQFLFQEMRKRHLTLKEAQIVVSNLDCIIRKLEKRNPDIPLSAINSDLEDQN